MPIDPAKVQWDAPAKIDPASVQWDAPEGQRSFGEQLKRELYSSVPFGIARGAKDLIDTGAEWLSKLGGAGEAARVREMNEAGNADFDAMTENSTVAPIARVVGQVLATAPVGGVLATPLKAGAKVAPALAPVADAVATSGFRAAGAEGVKGALARTAGGAATGGASVALVDPEQAGTGALVGAVTPTVLRGLGQAGAATIRTVRGPAVPESISSATASARQAGYVIPPSQAKPTLVNRGLEGLAGKISTAQNASARNQPITNDLARRAIGAEELTPEAIRAVRNNANASYDDLAAVGTFKADDAYRSAIEKAGGSKALPGIVNRDVDELIDVLSKQTTLDAQQTIESLKRLRFDGSANKVSQDPTKKALGKAQTKIAKALEDLIERDLQSSGRPELLASFREARTTLAKVYDVEKALNTSTGNVDAAKLAALLKKDRPLTGDLRQVADFASQFPKAAQMPEKMGSLPQVSPLDFGAAGAIGALTSSPSALAGLFARPAARAAVLSPMVQNRLVAGPQSTVARRLLEQSDFGLLPYRAAPLTATDR